MLSIIIAATIIETIILAGDTNIKVNEPSSPKNGTKKFLKISTLFNTLIYQQEKEVGSLTTLLQTFQTKYCILTYCRDHQLVIMSHRI